MRRRRLWSNTCIINVVRYTFSVEVVSPPTSIYHMNTRAPPIRSNRLHSVMTLCPPCPIVLQCAYTYRSVSKVCLNLPLSPYNCRMRLPDVRRARERRQRSERLARKDHLAWGKKKKMELLRSRRLQSQVVENGGGGGNSNYPVYIHGRANPTDINISSCGETACCRRRRRR